MSEEKPTNVVSLADARAKSATEAPSDETEASFEAIEARNKANAERLQKARLAANKAVLRSHRIKH